MSNHNSCKCRLYQSALASSSAICDTSPLSPCVEAPCGDPDTLSSLVPVIYDQVGLNLCNTVSLPADFATTYPTAASATIQVLDISFLQTEVVITQLTNRPNCSSVYLTNLSVSFLLKVYDNCNHLLGTVPLTATYLPSDTTDPAYDAETNPTAVQLELYTPYGFSYTGEDLNTPRLSYIGFTNTNSSITQGLNLTSMAKVLNLDTVTGTVTIGLTLYLMSIYHSPYKLRHDGKACAKKATVVPEDESLCMSFVEGDLLNMSIKPLEIPCECNCSCSRDDDRNS